MKVIEILKLGKKTLELLQESCVKVSDVRYVSLFDEYSHMVMTGLKVSYAVSYLAEKYGISERQVYYIVKKFSSECKILAG